MVKDFRLKKGLTQEQLSVSSGVKLSTIQKIEMGTNNIMGARVETVYKIAKALDVSVEELIESYCIK